MYTVIEMKKLFLKGASDVVKATWLEGLLDAVSFKPNLTKNWPSGLMRASVDDTAFTRCQASSRSFSASSAAAILAFAATLATSALESKRATLSSTLSAEVGEHERCSYHGVFALFVRELCFTQALPKRLPHGNAGSNCFATLSINWMRHASSPPP